MMPLPKLPIGIQTFEKLREEGYIYVDKTKYLVDLIDRGSVYFLSRPRRFGKSLTVSTFDALFSGKRELFKGLCAEEFLNRPDYKTHPVIYLDMSRVTTDMGPDVFRSSISSMIQRNAERLGVRIEPECPSPGDAFDTLIIRVAEKYAVPVVVLVDEYDKPILDHVHDVEKARETRRIVRNFYARIKAADAHLRFVFITGISKFSKIGAFATMNNLIDISMNDRYAAMLGYTEEELLTCFDAYIGETAAGLEESKEKLSAAIRGYYGGFSFDGKTRLYNPFAVLNFFNEPSFKNYWFESGTLSALTEYVKRHDLEAESFRGLDVPENFTAVAEIEHAPPESFLFQNGYLSVRERRGRKLVLDYPNMEVLSAVADLFLWNRAVSSGTGAASIDLEEFLARGDAEGLVKIYDALLAGIPYDIYERKEQKYARNIEEDYIQVPYAESFYHALLFTLLWSSRVRTSTEARGYWSGSHVEAEKNGHRYVVGLKVAEGKEAAKQATDDAMKEIRDKGYADKYVGGETTLVTLAVDRERRRVGGYRIENYKPGVGEAYFEETL